MTTKTTTLVLSSASIHFPLLLGCLEGADAETLRGRVDRVIGTSAGAVIGALFVAGYSPREILDESLRRGLTREAFLRCNPLNLFLLKTLALMDNAWIREVLEELLAGRGLDTGISLGEFRRRTGVRLTLAAFNVTRGQPEALDALTHPHLRLVDALLASSAVPLFFPPVECRPGEWFCDGALTHFFAVDWVEEGADAVGLGVAYEPSSLSGADLASFRWIVSAFSAALLHRQFNPPPFPHFLARHAHGYLSPQDPRELFERGAAEAAAFFAHLLKKEQRGERDDEDAAAPS